MYVLAAEEVEILEFPKPKMSRNFQEISFTAI